MRATGGKRGEVTPEASFIEDLGADSLDIVELVMALEEEYEMEISDEDAEKIRLSRMLLPISKRIVKSRGWPDPIRFESIAEAAGFCTNIESQG